jgi:type IV secretory pathway VirB10-like protein
MAVARFLLEAGFLVLVVAAVGLAGLGWVWIAVGVFCAWLLVAVVERSWSRSGANSPAAKAEHEQEPIAETPSTEPPPESEPELEAEPVPDAKPVLAVAPAPPPPAPKPAPEPSPEPEVVVPLVRRDSTPREWNVWDLEHIASEQEGQNPARDEERTVLLMSLRQFANASGDLPVDFDPLIREAFGTALDELRMQGLR